MTNVPEKSNQHKLLLNTYIQNMKSIIKLLKNINLSEKYLI